MKDSEQEQLLIRKYLLGELGEEQQEQLERRVITNPDYKEEVLITEEELLEDFVNGTLPSQERALFLKKYSSSPAQLRKVQVARALSKYAGIHPITPQSGPSETSGTKSLLKFFYKRHRFSHFSLATLVLLLVAGGCLLAYWWISRDERVNYARLIQLNGPESQVLQPDEIGVVSVTLPPLLLRGTGETKIVTITKQTDTVQVRLAAPSEGAQRFQATLKDRAGAEVFKLEDLQPRSLGQLPVLVLQIPAKMLRAQEYQLEIYVKNADGTYGSPFTYFFQVRETS
jgi:hypothetical protein